jgi:hypothetical protein
MSRAVRENMSWRIMMIIATDLRQKGRQSRVAEVVCEVGLIRDYLDSLGETAAAAFLAEVSERLTLERH